MTLAPYVADPDFTLYCGDAVDVLRELPAESVNCCATSPPFFGLRDYGVEGQIGLEATPEEWAARLVAVFAEARRVLAPHGTLWIECGDSYGTGTGAKRNPSTTAEHGLWENSEIAQRVSGGVKAKDIIGSPFLLAFALRAGGWWWRSMNIWHKPNALPESATDRPAVAHSYVMQFSKRARYYHDAEAVREPAEWARWGDQTVVKEQPGKAGWIEPRSKEYLTQGRTTNGPRSTENREQTPGFEQRLVSADGKKNLRSVWTIPTQGFPEAHFATWPEALVEKILLMACPDGGAVLDPFLGSGTTAFVARRLGRCCVGIELNVDYCAMAAKRLEQLSLLAEA